ncbi:MAG: CBS domain-containing protein [Peptococcaceae bacterium]|nr:CBS domain-containing protein [Peptococcaceae bacterium]
MVPIDDYNTISEEATLYEAIKVLRGSFHRDGRAWYGHRSVIVLGGSGELVGILSLRGILKAAGLRELNKDPEFKAESWGWYYVDRLRSCAKMRVRDVMRPLAVATVDAGDTVGEVAAALLKHRVNSLPVLKRGKLAGMVRTLDVFMVIGDYFK